MGCPAPESFGELKSYVLAQPAVFESTVRALFGSRAMTVFVEAWDPMHNSRWESIMPMLVSTFAFLPLATVVVKVPELVEFRRKPEYYARMVVGPAAWDSLERLGLMNRVVFEPPPEAEGRESATHEQQQLKYAGSRHHLSIAPDHIFTSVRGDTVRYAGDSAAVPADLAGHPLWRAVEPMFMDELLSARSGVG